MSNFLITFALVTLALLVCALPVAIVGWRRGNLRILAKFAGTAAGFGLVSALAEFGSRRLVDRCLAAGNPNCVDFGITGFLVLLIFGYLVASITAAIRLFRS